METPYPTRRTVQRLSRRGLLQVGLAAGVTLDLAALVPRHCGERSGTAQARWHPRVRGGTRRTLIPISP